MAFSLFALFAIGFIASLYGYGRAFGKFQRHIKQYQPKHFVDMRLDNFNLMLGTGGSFWNAQTFISNKDYLKLDDDVLSALSVSVEKWGKAAMISAFLMIVAGVIGQG